MTHWNARLKRLASLRLAGKIGTLQAARIVRALLTEHAMPPDGRGGNPPARRSGTTEGHP